MKNLHWVVVSCLVMGLTSGCDNARKVFGKTKNAPDEFAVYTRAPLSLPPDYGLRPPTPGAARQQEVAPRNEAKRVVLGAGIRELSGRTRPAGTDAASSGVQSLLKETGALEANPEIRNLVDRETSVLSVEDKSFTERLMFWGVETEYGTVVDPSKESKRIGENQALGRPINQGDVPTIARKRRALLEDLFN